MTRPKSAPNARAGFDGWPNPPLDYRLSYADDIAVFERPNHDRAETLAQIAEGRTKERDLSQFSFLMCGIFDSAAEQIDTIRRAKAFGERSQERQKISYESGPPSERAPRSVRKS
jgi:hypothetical protein